MCPSSGYYANVCLVSEDNLFVDLCLTPGWQYLKLAESVKQVRLGSIRLILSSDRVPRRVTVASDRSEGAGVVPGVAAGMRRVAQVDL